MEQPTMPSRLAVAITGASGAIYGVRLLEVLQDTPVETHLILSSWAMKTIAAETARDRDELLAMADYTYREDNQAARLSSGSFLINGMIVAPCSMKTLAAIANGYSENLIQRAADVTLKEGRKLVLLVRETPLHAIHLENMLRLARMGVVIMPPVPAFYARPQSLEQMVDQTVGRALDQFGIHLDIVRRWGGRLPRTRAVGPSENASDPGAGSRPPAAGPIAGERIKERATWTRSE